MTTSHPRPSETAGPADSRSGSRPASATVLPPRGITAFLVVTFAWSWLTWWLGPLVVDATDAGVLMLLIIVGGFGPAVGAVVVTAATDGSAGMRALFAPFTPRGHGGARPVLIAVIVTAVILATIPVALLSGMSLDGAGVAAGLASLPMMVLLVAFAGGGNEELGWRGFLLPRLQSSLSPVAASIVLGLVWAVWHAPLWTLAGSSQSRLSFPVYVVLVIAISIVLTHVTNAARGGLIAAVATHTAVNVAAGFAASVLGGVREADQAIAMAALAVVLVVVTRGRLGASRSPAPLPLPLHSTPLHSTPLHSTPSEGHHDHH